MKNRLIRNLRDISKLHGHYDDHDAVAVPSLYQDYKSSSVMKPSLSSKNSKGRSQSVLARRSRSGTMGRPYSKFREKDISDLNQSESSDTFTKQEGSSLISWLR
mmetsp:Transcript_13447/g.11939  ORF Transcript_13447/g.11939 Transcript_13447/m.11939 type:complete len:104 (+) Transcript_13447:629-940(+)